MSIESKKGLRIFSCRRIWSDLASRVAVYDWEERRLGPNGRGMKKGCDGGKRKGGKGLIANQMGPN